MNTKTIDTYKTKDLFEASWLYSQNKQLINLEPDIDYLWFVFQDEISCKNLSSQYWSQNAVGNIKTYVNSFKTLRDLIFSQGGKK